MGGPLLLESTDFGESTDFSESTDFGESRGRDVGETSLDFLEGASSGSSCDFQDTEKVFGALGGSVKLSRGLGGNDLRTDADGSTKVSTFTV